MSKTIAEVTSQPEVWEWALSLVPDLTGLPDAGERVAVVGCGTSWFMAQAYAALRESRGLGETDAFAASELPARRAYDRVVAISRSGTTTEVVDLLAATSAPSVLLTAVPDSPAGAQADHTIVLDRADETSVVQTRFATTVLLVLRASLREDVAHLPEQARAALAAEIDPAWTTADQVTFLGAGWTVGLAHEAALKFRESSQSWTESYPAMEYRHGPISIAQPGRVVWMFGTEWQSLADDVAPTGATFLTGDHDPLAQLVLLHRCAVARAEALGLDPDNPRHLSRSVILPSGR